MLASRLVAIACLFAACADAPVSRVVGARCDRSGECDDRCLAPGADYPGGMCTVSCDGNADCPGDTACVADESGVCLFRCSSDGDCGLLGTGWACRDRNGRPDGTVKVCRGA